MNSNQFWSKWLEGVQATAGVWESSLKLSSHAQLIAICHEDASETPQRPGASLRQAAAQKLGPAHDIVERGRQVRRDAATSDQPVMVSGDAT